MPEVPTRDVTDAAVENGGLRLASRAGRASVMPRRRLGYRRLFVLLRQQGEPSGRNRIYGLYRDESLSVRKRRARRRGERHSCGLQRALAMNV